MRASRLVSLLGLLQARGRMSTRQLAAELEVCERTVLRDIEALSGAGIPVFATRGRRGGFELMDGFTSDLAGGRDLRRARLGTCRGEAPASTSSTGGEVQRARRGAAAPGRPTDAGGAQRALIRLSPRGRRLAALLGRPAGLHIRRHAAAVPGQSDWIEAWIRVGSPDIAILDLLALGAEAEVVRPPELRAQMAQVALRIAARYTGVSESGVHETGAGSDVLAADGARRR